MCVHGGQGSLSTWRACAFTIELDREVASILKVKVGVNLGKLFF